jgi:hypothetical protein
VSGQKRIKEIQAEEEGSRRSLRLGLKRQARGKALSEHVSPNDTISEGKNPVDLLAPRAENRGIQITSHEISETVNEEAGPKKTSTRRGRSTQQSIPLSQFFHLKKRHTSHYTMGSLQRTIPYKSPEFRRSSQWVMEAQYRLRPLTEGKIETVMTPK